MDIEVGGSVLAFTFQINRQRNFSNRQQVRYAHHHHTYSIRVKLTTFLETQVKSTSFLLLSLPTDRHKINITEGKTPASPLT